MIILNFFLNLIPYKYLKDREDKEFFKEREYSLELREKCKKEMILFIDSRGIEKELIVSPLVNLVRIGQSAITAPAITLDELRNECKKLAKDSNV